MTMVAKPGHGGSISIRTFVPHHCHASIGVLGAVSVATACLLSGSVANAMAVIPEGQSKAIIVETPSGATECLVDVDSQGIVNRAAILRTARKLFDGVVFR